MTPTSDANPRLVALAVDAERRAKARAMYDFLPHVLRHRGIVPAALALSDAPGPLGALAKAAVAAHSGSNSSALNAHEQAFADDLQQEFTLLGRTSGWTPAGPHAYVAGAVSEPQADWIGPDLTPLPFAKIDFSGGRMEPTSFGFCLAETAELERASGPRGQALIRARAGRGLASSEDGFLLDAEPYEPGRRPAGLLASAPLLGGGSPASLAADVEALVAYVSDGGAQAGAFITSPRGAVWLASQSDALFRATAVRGGSIAGFPLVTSKAAGRHLVFIDLQRLVVFDGGLGVETTENASVLMDSAPTSPSALTSAWQSNSVVLRFIRRIHWRLIGDDAIAYVLLPLAGSPS